MKEETHMSDALPLGLLLALTGGILDAYTYLNRGQVFATAETGNLVLLGINCAMGQWRRAAWRSVWPWQPPLLSPRADLTPW